MIEQSLETASRVAWDWETEVRRTLAAPDELTTVLEPISSCQSSQLMAIEGLTRSPRVGSKELFHRACALGLDVTLELCTLRRLLDRFAIEDTEVRFGVNVSPSIAGTPAIQELFWSWSDRLILEISEENIIRDPIEFARSLVPLRERGAQIALDNAGVGYGGLSLLVALEPEWVKLDRRLVGTLTSSHTSRSIVGSMTTVAHRIGARVIGVGVEREEELEELRAFDVDAWQGYLDQAIGVSNYGPSVATALRDQPAPAGASVTLQIADSASTSITHWLRAGVTSLDDAARVTDGCFELGWVTFRDIVTIARSC